MSELHVPKVAILASGSGTTAEAFILATLSSSINIEVPLVISNNPDPGVFEKVRFLNRAHKLGIEMVHISSKQYPFRTGELVERGQTPWESEKICEVLDKYGIDNVELMGYMKKVTGDLVGEYGYLPEHTSPYQARMGNSHPAALPLTADTYGIHAIEKVLASGRKTNEHTFHLVSAGVDQGPVMARHRLPIFPGDSPQDLFVRTQKVEKRELPKDIDKFLKDQAAYYANV